MRQVDVVVGGGIAGLLAALVLAERDRRSVVVVERDRAVGGLLKCFDYGDHGIFDHGMHTMYETGIPELDRLLFGLLPASEWQVLEGIERDLAGTVFGGSVQHHSPFPDLRSLSHRDWDDCTSGFFRQLEHPEPVRTDTCWDFLCGRFGRPIANVLDGVVRNQFGKPAGELAPFAAKLTTLSRVVLFGESLFSGLSEVPVLRERLAWPQQRTLPVRWQSGRRSWYPKAYGIHRVIGAMTERLERAGVRILTEAQAKGMAVDSGAIRTVTVERQGREETIGPVGQVVWTSGLPAVARALGVDPSGWRFDPARTTVVVNLLLRDAPHMGDLHYLYCFESGCSTFRITNYCAYCQGAVRKGAWPISVELLIDPPVPAPQRLVRDAIAELVRFGVVTSPGQVLFSAAEPLAMGFPMPSCRNFRQWTAIREQLAARRAGNLTVLGVMSEPDVFFQRDVLAQTWQRLTSEEARHERVA